MPAVQHAVLNFGTDDEFPTSLRISLLPRENTEASPPLLIDANDDIDRDMSLAAIQLLEGAEYRYEWVGSIPEGKLEIQPGEFFHADTSDGRSGRLRPGLATGLAVVCLYVDGRLVAAQELEVRSRKLDYISQYQWMLRDIANQMAELLMERFGASNTFFAPDPTRDPATLYQRFAFLRALLLSEQFKVCIAEVTRRPHVLWTVHHEIHNPGRGLQADSNVTRQFSRPGPKLAWPTGVVSSIPKRIDRRRTEATHDTPANRFVKFALERWRQVVSDIEEAITSLEVTYAAQRAHHEVRQVLDELDQVLSHELFREVGILNRFPADDQVLHRREGYREVFRAYVEFEIASQLGWAGGEDVYAAGQRDVATLYEYWAFLQLTNALSTTLGAQFDLSALFEMREGGLSLSLRGGTAQVLSGVAERNGRKLKIELWFNRTFSPLSGDSWTRNMRPDFSLRIEPARDESAPFQPVFLHFDAKYKVDHLRELFGDTRELANGDERKSTATRTDLLKMHAYRDAIHRSAGAYILYPGTDSSAPFREYHELLPGLGAFVLRPTRDGEAQGIQALGDFIEAVLDHVSLQTTQHERGRYWLEEAYARYSAQPLHFPPAPFILAPPADVRVLLGFVRSATHWNWIVRAGKYNVRAGDRPGAVEVNSRLLACDLLVLSCPSMTEVAIAEIAERFVMHTEEEMTALGYPSPEGPYFCATIRLIDSGQVADRLISRKLEQLRLRKSAIPGAPVTATWLEIASACASDV